MQLIATKRRHNDYSLIIKAKEKIIFFLTDVNIDVVDKAELMINLYQFLDENKYEENIKVLKKEQMNEKWNRNIHNVI